MLLVDELTVNKTHAVRGCGIQVIVLNNSAVGALKNG